MNKACFVLILAMSPASLFAGETMATPSTPPSGCNFRVDKCETSVATDTSYIRFKDGKPGSGTNLSAANADPALYASPFGFADYPSVHHDTVQELVALIKSKLGNCPEVTVTYDADSGNITVHYLHTTCDDCNCDWVVNVRNVTADDFVWKRTSDNYSPRLGQMERRKFHTASEQDAQEIESACVRICGLNSWTMFK